MNHSSRPPRVVIIGGGFAGLYATRALAGGDVDVTLIDRRNFHLFQPLLYQVGTGSLSPANIAAPLRSILRGQQNVSVLLGEVEDFDLDAHEVVLADGDRVGFDYLIVATGSTHHYFGHPEWEQFAPGLKTVEDATEIRQRLLLAFEDAERSNDEAEARRLLTFVVVGGGPTGVEMAGAIAEIARDTLRHDYRHIRTDEAHILLVEALDRILPTYKPELSRRAEDDLRNLGVDVRTGTMVRSIDANGLEFAKGDVVERIESCTVIWAAGVQASSLGEKLAMAAGLERDRSGRLTVGSDLTLPGHPEVFVAGDLAHVEQDGKSLPAVAPVAMQEGRHAADVIAARLHGETAAAFRYKDRGSMATIGRSAAVADLGFVRLTGAIGWLAWLFIHIMQLAGFENRLLVATQWGWSYLTRNRAARLITGRRRPQRPDIDGDLDAKNTR
ncbi:MAG: NAD(P)/FAD-dependent oxidoreductase [Dehalococcoidia bacterium]